MRESSASKTSAKRRDAGNIALNVVLVAAVVALAASLLSGAASGTPRPILGWSASTVLTGSMQDVYPKGSLIVTRYTDPWDLQAGDDVTFLETADTSITHRIIEVVPNLEGARELAFKTQGTMNPYPDDGYVLASGVIGKVVFCSPELGVAVNWLKTYWAIPVFLVALAIGTKAALARINKTDKAAENPKGGDAGKTRAKKAQGARAASASRQRRRPTICVSGAQMQSDADEAHIPRAPKAHPRHQDVAMSDT